VQIRKISVIRGESNPRITQFSFIIGVLPLMASFSNMK